MKRIWLRRGICTFVDDEDYKFLSQYSWHLHLTPSGKKYARIGSGDRIKSISMHRLLLEAPFGIEVDHINGNGLDNRRKNLRLCSSQQNRRNMKPRSQSRYKGVTWRKNRRKWVAQIELGDRKNVYLGSFSNPKDAARAYNEAARTHFGEFAWLNRIK